MDTGAYTQVADQRLKKQEKLCIEYAPLESGERREVILKYSEFIRFSEENARNARDGVITEKAREAALLYNYHVLRERVEKAIGPARCDALFGSAHELADFQRGGHGTPCASVLAPFM